MGSVYTPNTQSADRRRRFLAKEDVATDHELLREYGIVPMPTPSKQSPLDGIGETLIRKLISHRPWKCWSIALGLMLTTVLSLVWGFAAAASEGFGRNIQMLIAGTAGGLTSLLLLLSAQVSMLIGWIRSHSSVDYSGRYRSWYWLGWYLAALAGLCCFHSITDAATLSATILQPLLGAVASARQALLLVPVLAVASAVSLRIIPDMGRNRPIQVLFFGSLVCALLSLAAGIPTMRERSEWLLYSYQAGLQPVIGLTATSILFSACLLHCHFVAYVSNDPPALKTLSEGGEDAAADCESVIGEDADPGALETVPEYRESPAQDGAADSLTDTERSHSAELTSTAYAAETPDCQSVSTEIEASEEVDEARKAVAKRGSRKGTRRSRAVSEVPAKRRKAG